jgi:hypothetical protein
LRLFDAARRLSPRGSDHGDGQLIVSDRSGPRWRLLLPVATTTSAAAWRWLQDEDHAWQLM